MFYKKRICSYCGKEFYATSPGQKYCSYECKMMAKREHNREYRRGRIERGRGSSPKLRRGDKCALCGYDIHYALEYSHEVNDFLCANCHRTLHPGSRRRMTDAMEFVFPRFPVKIFGALYDPGPPYEPERCYLCKRPITPVIWERHHMIPKSEGGEFAGNEDIVIICANCHRILTRANGVIQKYFIQFLNSESNPYYPNYTTPDQFNRLSLVMQVEIIRRFYQYLREIWIEILSQLR